MTDRTATSWSAVAVAVLAGVVAAMHIGKLPPALPLIRGNLGFGLVMGGFVVSLFSVLDMTLAVFLGAMADWLGRERRSVRRPAHCERSGKARGETPRQEAGRFAAIDLVLSRANKSVRMFEHVVSRQPDPGLIRSVGYLIRTTAVYGNGKFGIADRSRIAGRPTCRPRSGPRCSRSG